MDRKIHPHTPHPPYVHTHTQSTTQTTSMPKVLHSPPEKKRIEIKRTWDKLKWGSFLFLCSSNSIYIIIFFLFRQIFFNECCCYIRWGTTAIDSWEYTYTYRCTYKFHRNCLLWQSIIIQRHSARLDPYLTALIFHWIYRSIRINST